MNPRSIENKALVNLDNCESEPIHIPGSIQPHGYLLAITASYDIRFCSANAAEYGFQPGEILNRNIASVFSGEEGGALVEYLNHRIFESSKPHAHSYHDILFNVSVHVSGEYFILEFEPLPDGNLDLSDLYFQTKKFTDVLSKAVGLKELCQLISGEIKNITGYDRVMIYKFDENYNGEVFAESRNEELEPFLGLHYPHTDIPAQARELYLRNLLRIIVDINYTPVPILTLDTAASNQQLDLSNSILRSVSPIHVEYLKNMGVGGSLTISLIKEGKLWGLVACHHYSAKHLPYYTRLSSLLQGHFLTSQIRVQEVAADYVVKLELDKKLAALLSRLDDFTAAEENNILCEELIRLTNAGGVMLSSGTSNYTYGDVPDTETFKQLQFKLSVSHLQFIASNNISRDFELVSDGIAGLLHYKLDEYNMLTWFRREIKTEINWAGDPDKSIIKNEKGLSPRKSFSIWREIVSGFSAPWQEAEVEIANQCIYAVQKHFSFIKSRQVQRTQNNLLEELKQVNQELENLNWISTHDLKEPLRKIKTFASILLDQNKFSLDDSAVQILQRIDSSSDKMKNLLNDLMAYSRVKTEKQTFIEADLNELLKEVLADYRELLDEKNIIYESTSLPVIFCIPVLVRQLFTNIISNAIKFSRADNQPVISISSTRLHRPGEEILYEITFKDNGKGFERTYNKLIFQPFQRLEKTSQTQGTGIGLAICKKIVEIHRGEISAEATPGEGAIFTILLPQNPGLTK